MEIAAKLIVVVDLESMSDSGKGERIRHHPALPHQFFHSVCVRIDGWVA
jgi:hypothetical protein